HSLPQFNSIEALEICNQKRINIPFILVTGAVSEEFAASCIKKGADDYVLKSNLSRLPMAIQYALRQRAEINIRKQQEERLRTQNEELRKLYRELDLFVNSSSHNLRAPLRSILGLVSLCRMDEDTKHNENMQHYFTMMESSIGQLDNTLKFILEFSRDSAVEKEAHEIDFRKVIENIFVSLNYMNGPQPIEQITIVNDGPPFYCDAMRLNLVLLNLISNAMKYFDSAKEKSFIKVQVHHDSDRVIIIIEDNGIGIAEEQQGRVFDMYYRATQNSEGFGLGLYIVRETLEQMNGSILLQSIKGIGTIFTITIPRSRPL
ncbi:MAG: hybrid sensor histidine kinase/response regulator, partial [Marivirga sp.]|nr:hybrid sensor histidine kinase/response regulator [Marivirga sp.]